MEGSELPGAAGEAGPGTLGGPGVGAPLQNGEAMNHVLPSSITGAFGGLVDAHNGLAHKHSDTQKQLDAIVQEQLQTSQRLRELAAGQEALRSGQEQRLQDMQRQSGELQEALKQLLEEKNEKSDALEQKQLQAVRAVDEALKPRVDALQRSLEDIASAHSEITTRTLPRWRADAGSEIQKLGTDLAAHREQHDASKREHESRLAEQAAELSRSQEALERRLSEAMDAIRARLDTAESGAASTSGALAESEAKHRERDAHVAALGTRMEARACEEAQGAVAAIRAEEGTRLTKLEMAFKHLDFERLTFSEHLRQGLEDVRAAVAVNQEQGAERMEADTSRLEAALEETRKSLEQRIASEVDELGSRIAGIEASSNSALSAGLSGMDSAIREQMEVQSSKLEARAIQEANAALVEIRNDEGVRLARLEGKFSDTDQAHQDFRAHYAQDMGSLRADMASGQEQAIRQIEDSHVEPAVRLEKTQQGVEDLAEIYRELAGLQVRRDQRLDEIEQTLKAYEVRRFPWRVPRERSQSPNTGRGNISYAADSSGATTVSSPPPPGGPERGAGGGPERGPISPLMKTPRIHGAARPGSAALRRRPDVKPQEAKLEPKDEDTSDTPIPTSPPQAVPLGGTAALGGASTTWIAGAPAGAAYRAAHATRRGNSTKLP